MIRCKGYRLSDESRSDMSAGHSDVIVGLVPTTSMKKGWLCRTSCDEKNEEITPFD